MKARISKVDALPEFPEGEILEPGLRRDGKAADALLVKTWSTDPDGFSEERYLTAFPDIARAVATGELASGREHYVAHGQREGRLNSPSYLGAASVKDKDTANFPGGDIDAAFVSRNGWSLIIGWLNDDTKPLRAVAWLKDGEVMSATAHVARCRRDDAEAVAGASHGKLLGFWTVIRPNPGLTPSGNFQIRLWAGDECKTFKVELKPTDNQQLREMALEYFASARYFANQQAESVHQLESGLGKVLTDLNQEIIGEILQGAYVARFGQPNEPLAGSFIVCLFGKAEYLFVQAALFSQCAGIGSYEFVFVSNSPELAERLVKEAAMAHRIYNVLITLVILPSNAGFGAANNIAVTHARSKRILIMNPDVFPRDQLWASRHSEIIANRPVSDTKIFGAPLYYDDGSLMHGGMYFDIDAGVSIRDGQVQAHEIIRVEHYGKGAPPDTEAFLQSRRVPAVTGAFISVDRSWFEYLGGFSTEYVFGHYEDADLCLKSLKKGHPVWVHHVPFWHLEGKGSTRRLVHEGGSTVNRWHFTEQWKDFIADGLLGKEPARLAST